MLGGFTRPFAGMCCEYEKEDFKDVSRPMDASVSSQTWDRLRQAASVLQVFFEVVRASPVAMQADAEFMVIEDWKMVGRRCIARQYWWLLRTIVCNANKCRAAAKSKGARLLEPQRGIQVLMRRQACLPLWEGEP